MMCLFVPQSELYDQMLIIHILLPSSTEQADVQIFLNDSMSLNSSPMSANGFHANRSKILKSRCPSRLKGKPS